MNGYKYLITNKPWLIILLRFITICITIYYETAAFQLLDFADRGTSQLLETPFGELGPNRWIFYYDLITI